jgi:hypothetical protein
MRIDSTDELDKKDSILKRLYCIAMVDIDRMEVVSKGRSPTKKGGYTGYLHWAVVNISIADFDKYKSFGEEVIISITLLRRSSNFCVLLSPFSLWLMSLPHLLFDLASIDTFSFYFDSRRSGPM